MPTKKTLSVNLVPVVATVIRPVATRLNRIEDLLIEMRGVLDYHLKPIAAIQKQADILTETDRVSGAHWKQAVRARRNASACGRRSTDSKTSWTMRGGRCIGRRRRSRGEHHVGAHAGRAESQERRSAGRRIGRSRGTSMNATPLRCHRAVPIAVAG
jgi:hypothetical protein